MDLPVVLEIAVLEITPGSEDAFEQAYASVKHEVADTPGCLSMRLVRGIESPSRFTLMVEWESVEAHEQNFRASERFPRWRAGIGPHFAQPPAVEHYSDIG
ncbi:MAG TPA: antibiotic biosynthesis monooxygenase family protein [Mycobacteriales bacterium]|nr:antibiotic biosynthesis monooxygenase family protein [Mycobacteriales bacterium]